MSLRDKLHGFARLTRIEHGLILGFVPVSTYLLTCSEVNFTILALLYLSALLAEIYLFTENDLFNLREDRINRPDAPLVRGLISIKSAIVITAVALAAGLMSAMLIVFIDPSLVVSLVVYVTALLVGTLYNLTLKRLFLIGNIATALTTSLAFLYGLGLNADNFTLPVMLFLTSLIASLGREFLKTVLDVKGDLAAGYRTIAVVLGAERTMIIARKVEITAMILLGLTAIYAIYTLGLASIPLVAGSVTTIYVLYAKLNEDAGKLRSLVLKLMALVIMCYFTSAILYRII